MRLFKYTSIEIAVNILINQSLRFTQPIVFNDPFDAFPFVAKLYSKEEQRLLLDNSFSNTAVNNEIVLTSFYKTLETEYPDAKLKFDKDDLLKMFYSIIDKQYGSISNFVLSQTSEEEMLELIINNFITNVLTLTGILSLTKDPKNLLMWAHYADCHRGVVFEFESSHSFFHQSDNGIYPTEIETIYTENRPKLEFHINDLSDSKNLLKLFSDIYFTKSTDWKYEAEYRVVRRLTENTFAGFQDKNGFDIHLFPFPKEIIKGVIFGNRVSTHDIERIKNIIDKNKYDNVCLSRINLDNTKYLLHIVEL